MQEPGDDDNNNEEDEEGVEEDTRTRNPRVFNDDFL
jgi:hypothetical protein